MCPHAITIFSLMKSSAIICKHRNIMISFEPIEQARPPCLHPCKRVDFPTQPTSLVDPTHVFQLPSSIKLEQHPPRHDHHAPAEPPARMIVIVLITPIPASGDRDHSL